MDSAGPGYKQEYTDSSENVDGEKNMDSTEDMDNTENESYEENGSTENTNEEGDEPVPQIIVEDVNDLPQLENSPIRSKAENIKFPLSPEDERDLVKLVLRFESKEHIAGLAAPQIGINKRAFVFEVDKDEENKDEQAFEKSIWINPTYRNADGATLDEDYESCFSIKSQESYAVGPVFRFNRIFYRAYDTQGRILEGEAKGFAARVIQHEIDHLDGKLFADYVQPERLLSLHSYAGRLQENTLDELQTGIVPEFL